MTSEIRTNSITSRAGLSTVTLSDTGPIVTGIATFGVNTKIDGGNNVINVGTALTIGHTQGVQFNTQNLHSNGFEVNNINASGIITATSFKGDGSQLTGISGGLSNIVEDTSPQLGGDLASNSHDILFADNDKAIFGTGSDFKIYHNGSHNYLMASNGDYVFDTGSSELVRITSAGNFGVGTNSPSAIIHATGSNTSTGYQFINTHTTSGFGVFIKGGGTTADRYALRVDDAAGNERFRINANGNTGINQTSPQRRLHIGSSGTAEANIRIQGGADYGEMRVKDGDNSLSFHVNMGNAGSVEKLKIQQSDATLYGTTDGVLNITTTDARGSFIRFQESGTSKVWVGCGQGLGLGAANDLGLRATNDIRFRSGAEEHAVLTADGYFAAKGLAGSWVSSNTHPAQSQFHQFTQTGAGKRIVVFRNEHHAGLGVNIEMSSTGNAESLYCTGNGSTRFRVQNNGNVGSASNSYGGISDIKLKENIVDAKSQWNDIKAIRVRNFNFKDTPDTKMLGVVAQEIETISPNLISELVDRDPETNETLETTTKEVKYSILYMKGIKCLQEAQARIEKLEEENIALRARVTNLEGN